MKKAFLLIFSFLTSLLVSAQHPIVGNTGSLNVPRLYHESQLMFNGKVLVFGGYNGSIDTPESFASAEIYNPATQSWTYTGSMMVKRYIFASEVLPDGNIIAIGGQDQDLNIHASCEKYNVSDGTWSPIAPMQQSRTNHSAIVLKNGKVLVAGGLMNDNRCELYDPTLDAWSYTGPLTSVRGPGLSLVMLNDGRILATGGTKAGRSGEIYDPVQGTWTAISSQMQRTRSYHSTLLLNDGRILIVGSGLGNFDDRVTVELFNPSNNTFTTTSNLLAAIAECEMTLMDDGRVLAYSLGVDASFDSKCIQVYNTSTETWTSDVYNFIGTTGATLNRLYNGKILIAGGGIINTASAFCLSIAQPGYESCIAPNKEWTLSGQSICAGRDAVLTLLESESGVSYQPFFANGISAGPAINGGGSIQLMIPKNNLSTGSHVVNVQLKKNGCVKTYLTDTAAVHIVQKNIPVPVITPSGPLSFCPGGSVTLTSSSSDSYLWSNGSTASSITLNKSGYYSVRTITADGCASPSSASVQTILYPATIDAGLNENKCQDIAAYSLSGQYPPGGIWSGTGVSPDGIFNPGIAGVGTFTLSYNQCALTATKTITVLPSATVMDFSLKSLQDSLCTNNNTYIDVVNPTYYASYQLKIGSSKVGGPKSNGYIRFNSGYLDTTTVFTVTGSLSNSCGSTEISKNITIKVIEDPLPHVGVTQDTICAEMVSIVKIADTKKNLKYRMFQGDPYVQGNGDTLTFIGRSPRTNGSGNWGGVSVHATNSLNCPVKEVYYKKVVGYTHKAEFNIQSGYLLPETVHIVNNSNGDQYKWKFGDSATIASSDLRTPPPYNYTSLGLKEVEMISISRFGCSKTVTQHTNIYNPAPSSSGQVCFLDTISSWYFKPNFAGLADDILNVLAFHVDSHNNSYLAGYSRSVQGGNYHGSYNMYLKKMSPDGNLLWEIKTDHLDYSQFLKYHSSFITGITTDANDNVYITGSYGSDVLKINNLYTTKQQDTYVESFIAKLNPSGITQWIIHGNNYLPNNLKTSGGTDILYVDDEHIYASLFRPDMLKFADGTTQTFDREIVIVQIDAEGKFKRSFSSQQYSMVFNFNAGFFNPDYSIINNSSIATIAPKMKLSSDGKIFLGGSISRAATFGTTTLQPVSGGLLYYIAIMDTVNGWENFFSTHSVLQENSYLPHIRNMPYFTLDQDNNIYVADYYYHNASPSQTAFIRLPDGTVLGDSTGSIVAKYGPSGNMLWYNHSALSITKGIEYLESSNQILVYGDFDNTYLGQTSQSLSPMAIKTSGGQDIFLTSISPAGNLNWMEKIGGVGSDQALGMASNSCSDVCILGKLEKRGGIKSDSIYVPNKQFFLSRFNPSGGCAPACNSLSLPLKVSVYSEQEDRTKHFPIPVYIKFNREVSGFDQNDLLVANATISGFTGSGSSYRAYLTPSGTNSVTALVPADKATDGSVNNLASNLFRIQLDTVPPGITISSTSGNYFNTSSLTLNVIASETIKGLTASDFQLSNCKISSFSGIGKNYTLTITPINEGGILVSLPNAVAIDSAGLGNTASNLFAGAYDITKPTATISTTSPNPTTNSVIPVVIKLSEPVQNFTVNQLNLSPSNATLSNFTNPSGDNLTFTVDVNCTSTNNHRISIGITVLRDYANNANDVSVSISVLYDITQPTVSLASSATSITSVSPIPVTLTFSEKVHGLVPASFAVTNGSVSGLTGSGTSYTAMITPAGNGTVTVRLPEGMVQDTVGNTNTASSVLTRTYDNQKPQVTIATTAPAITRTSPIPLTITFTESVTGFSYSDLIVVNGSIFSFNGAGPNYTASITPSGQGIVIIKINQNSVLDAALNGNLESNTVSLTYDNVRPTITYSSTSSNPTRDAVIPLTITFSEPVIGFTQSDISIFNVTLSNFSGDGKVYTVDLTPVNIGKIEITINAAIATDAASNTNISPGSYRNTYQGDDFTSPSISITSTAVSYTNLSPIPIIYTFSEATKGFLFNKSIVTNGTIAPETGNGVVFTASLIPSSQGIVTVRLPANSATDNALNPSLESNTFSIIYDNVKPASTITSISKGPTNEMEIPVIINFTEAVNNFSADDFSLTNATLTGFSGSGTSYTAKLRPISTGNISMNLNSDVAVDRAGNGNLPSSFSIVYAGTDPKPLLEISSTEGNATQSASIPLVFVFSEEVTGFVASDINSINGTISDFQGTGRFYSATLIPSGEGSITVSVNADAVTDGVSGNESTSYEVIYDISKPTVNFSSSENTSTSSSSFVLTITFSEPVSGFALSSLSVTNASINDLQGNGTVYTVLITPTSEGLLSVSLDPAGIVDEAENETETSLFSITYSPLTPIVSKTHLKDLNVYPIPCNGLLHLNFDSNLNESRITLTNLTGGMIYDEVILGNNPNTTLDISFLNDGAYYLQITNDQESVRKMIILQR